MIKARGRKLIVKLPRPQVMTDTGLHIPVELQGPPQEGIVLSKGPDCGDEFQVGDRVLFDQWSGLDALDPVFGDVLILDVLDLSGVIPMQ